MFGNNKTQKLLEEASESVTQLALAKLLERFKEVEKQLLDEYNKKLFAKLDSWKELVESEIKKEVEKQVTMGMQSMKND